MPPRAGIEIAEAGWFPLDAPPEGTSPRTRARLAAFRENAPMRGVW